MNGDEGNQDAAASAGKGGQGPLEQTVRRSAQPASAIGGVIGAVSGVVALLQNSDHLVLGIILIAFGAVLLLAWVYLWRRRAERVPVPLWLAAGAAVLTVLALAVAAATVTVLLRQDEPDPVTVDGVAATITSPKDAQRPPIDGGLVVAGTLSGTTPAFCRDHHVWIVGSAPTGAHDQELYSAREELPCKDGGWSIRDEITRRSYHRYAVRVTSEAGAQQYMVENQHAWKVRDYSQDGRWVTLPPSGVQLVSAVVTIKT